MAERERTGTNMPDESARLARAKALDAQSNDDLMDDAWNSVLGPNDEGSYPLDEMTLDEQSSTQLGEMFESRRRNAS